MILMPWASASPPAGRTNLHNVLVHPNESSGVVLVKKANDSAMDPFLQLLLAAVEAGIARNALNDAVAFARDFARPIKHSTASRSVEDSVCSETQWARSRPGHIGRGCCPEGGGSDRLSSGECRLDHALSVFGRRLRLRRSSVYCG